MAGIEVESGKPSDERLDEVVADYVRAIEAGNEPDREALLAQYPDLAEDLRDFFSHRDRMEKLLDPLRSAAAQVLNVRCPHCHHAIEFVDEAQLTDISCPTCGSSFSLIGTGSTRQFPNGMKRIGQFQLIDRVGVGQFGSVWKARDLTLERTVAVKIPRGTQLSKEEAELFIRDARLAAKLTHPNIVPVHEVGKHEDTIYIVSEFIQGATLKEWIQAKRLSPNESAELCVKVCHALHHAHESGVIHRDLKPGNIMLDVTAEPHIVDFGLAKRDTDEITMTLDGQILGTPAYMSPEQARGEGHHADRRADVYSMGVILFELLTGELPFRGDKQMLIVQILNDDPPSLRRLDNSVPRDLETICLKCLRKEAPKRYTTARALADDLLRWLDGQPIQARPVSHVEKAWMWCCRRPGISTLAALLAIVIAGATFISLEVRQRERANGLVNQLMSSGVAEAPQIISQLAPFASRAEPRIRNEASAAEAAGDVNSQLLTRLATFKLYGDVSDLDWLSEKLLSCRPADFPILREALSKHAQALGPRLWALAEDSGTNANRRIRACCALAAYDSESEHWDQVAPFVASHLVSVPLAELTVWREQFVPMSDELFRPLEAILENEDEWVQKRNFAADCLAAYLADQPEALFRLLMKSGEQQFVEIYPALAERRTDFLRLLAEELNTPLSEFVGQDEPHRFRRRQAFAAIAAWRMDRPDITSQILSHDANPDTRTCFIHWAAPLGVDPHLVVSRLRIETKDDIRQTLVLALGEFKPSRLSVPERDRLVATLLDIFRDDTAAGLHGSVEWLLREWGFRDAVKTAITQLQSDQIHGNDSANRWSVNQQGHTMVAVKADEFLIGSPFDVIFSVHVPLHRARIGRTFAIASKEVTRAQMERFDSAQGQKIPGRAPDKFSAEADSPQNQVTWYEATAYCNWLSELEGLPEDQWCYLPNADGEYAEGMRVAPGFLARSGYRLPTEAEWEFACRSSTTTLRSFGDSTDFLTKYAWFAQVRTAPVGSFKPNDFGLFDMLGNAIEWCHDRRRRYPKSSRQTVFVDRHVDGVVTNRQSRVLRGGAFNSLSSRIDSADRSGAYAPTSVKHSFGFRVARTLVPAADELAHAQWVNAQVLGRKGHWREAADMMRKAIPHLAEDLQKWAKLFYVQLYVGETRTVHAICDEMLNRFGDTPDPNMAHRLAGMCLVVPDREVTAQVRQLANLSATKRNPTHYRDMGMLHYRLGELEKAEQWLLKGVNVYLLGKPSTWYYLAMVRHKRGNEAGALKAFHEAEEYREELRQEFTDGDFGTAWYMWPLIESNRREAEAVLGAP